MHNDNPLKLTVKDDDHEQRRKLLIHRQRQPNKDRVRDDSEFEDGYCDQLRDSIRCGRIVFGRHFVVGY